VISAPVSDILIFSSAKNIIRYLFLLNLECPMDSLSSFRLSYKKYTVKLCLSVLSDTSFFILAFSQSVSKYMICYFPKKQGFLIYSIIYMVFLQEN